jgi:hypothetical protein
MAARVECQIREGEAPRVSSGVSGLATLMRGKSLTCRPLLFTGGASRLSAN